MSIFLCHKCAGILTGEVSFPSYHCHCMSGWVRDHQKPTPAIKVGPIQIQRQLDWLELYDRQGRAATDPARLQTIKLLDYIM
jgi:hypothetical protein